MSTQTLTVNVSDPLFQELKRRAGQTQRSVEEELLELLATNVPPNSDLPNEIVQAIESLNTLDDADLHKVARNCTPDQRRRDIALRI